jgi:HEAT repeat protein
MLLLENEDGSLAIVEEEELSRTFEQKRLRFAFLHSCRGAGGNAGLGPRLVELGVPAVVAMQEFVPMGDARRFAAAFYGALIQDGAVDIAANKGRQAIFRSQIGNWWIPVLFCRLKDGQVWKPDPVRAAIQKLAKEFQAQPSVQKPFPLDAILMRRGVALLQHGTAAASGPKLDLIAGSRQALECHETPPPFVVLLGTRGGAKSSHLRYLFADAAAKAVATPPDPTVGAPALDPAIGKDGSCGPDSDAPLRDGPLRDAPRRDPLPLLCYLADCVPEHGTPARTIAWAVNEVFRRHNITAEGLDVARVEKALNDQPFLLLVDGDDDSAAHVRSEAIARLREFQDESRQTHRILVTAGESTFDPTIYPERAGALILQPMTADRVSAYLKTACPDLERDLRATRLYDVAGDPWFLGRLIANSREGRQIGSRAQAFERFAREGLGRLEGSAGVRTRAEQVLSRVAWRMQSSRQSSLGVEIYAILAEVRGNRDFQLQQFLEGEILKQSGLLAWSGAEGVRFAYPGLQAYYCANYLRSLPAPDRERSLEDITATLGRLSRVRWWEGTLVVLAGLIDNPDALLRKIVAGGALTEGEQVFLAARCLHEARRAERTRNDRIGRDIVDQIVDTLVWRSRQENVRSTPTRRKAIEALSLLEEPRVIPHLVSVLTRKVRRDWEGQPAYDYSGVRLGAAQALSAMQAAVEKHIAEDPTLKGDQPTQQVLEAWLTRDVAALGRLFAANDTAMSAVAAFALGTINADGCLELLLQGFRERRPPSGRDDVSWAITDTLAVLDPIKVTEGIRPLLDREPWATYLAYLIGRLGIATSKDPEVAFLRKSLRACDDELRGRALRSYAALLGLQGRSAPAEELEELRELCHRIVQDKFDEAAEGTLLRCAASPSPRERGQLQYQALEALRSVGNEASIEVLREMRQREYDAPLHDRDDATREKGAAPPHRFNSQLSFEIAEEIYWRLTGGLSGETYGPLVASQ